MIYLITLHSLYSSLISIPIVPFSSLLLPLSNTFERVSHRWSLDRERYRPEDEGQMVLVFCLDVWFDSLNDSSNCFRIYHSIEGEMIQTVNLPLVDVSDDHHLDFVISENNYHLGISSMGIVQTLPSSENEYAHEIINRARALSVEIDDYLVSESYLLEMDQDAITPEALRVKCVDLVSEELSQIGIAVISPTGDEISSDVALTHEVLVLRAKFDEDKFYELIKDREDLQQILQSIGDSPVDALVTVITKFYEKHPLDEGWEFLAANADNLDQSDLFVDWIHAQLDRCGELGAVTPITSDNFLRTAQITMTIERQMERATTMALALAHRWNPEGSDRYFLEVEESMVGARRRLLNHPKWFPWILENSNITGNEDPFPYPKEYRATRRGWFDYWLEDEHFEQLPLERHLPCLVVNAWTKDDSEASLMVKINGFGRKDLVPLCEPLVKLLFEEVIDGAQ